MRSPTAVIKSFLIHSTTKDNNLFDNNMKILVFLATAHAAFAFSPRPMGRLAKPTFTFSAKPTKLVQPLQMAKDAKAEKKYCIPLEKVSLDDLPKVGG